MRDLTRNSIKVVTGLFFNLILLYFISNLHYIIIALIQTAAFALFYTVVDWVMGGKE